MNTVILIEDNLQDVDFLRDQFLIANNWLLLSSYSSTADCLEQAALTKAPNFIFLDIHLQHEIAIDAIPQIKKAYPSSSILMYTVSEQYDYLIKSFQKGASGYLVKTRDTNKLAAQLQIIQNDGAIISPEMARVIVKSVRNNGLIFRASNKLTDRDIDTLNLLASGMTYKQIAEQHHISVEGVRSRIRRMYDKLNVSSRWAAIQKYKQWNTL